MRFSNYIVIKAKQGGAFFSILYVASFRIDPDLVNFEIAGE